MTYSEMKDINLEQCSYSLSFYAELQSLLYPYVCQDTILWPTCMLMFIFLT
jgi:hypothetical protein